MKRVLLSLTFLTLTFPVFTAIKNVPAEYTTIQAALNAANSGDTILVHAGTYFENIIWPNKNGLVLTGVSKEIVKIDGSGIGSVIIISPSAGNIDAQTSIENLTITNGKSPSNGGGLFIANSSPTLQNLLINNNIAQFGCGIYLSSSNSTIKNCRISENNDRNLSGSGAGIYVTGGSPKLIGLTITKNSSNYGSAIFMGGGAITTIDSTLIYENDGRTAIYLYHYSTCRISNSQIKSNRPAYGIESEGTLILQNCIFKNNSGAELRLWGRGSCTVDSSIFDGSEANWGQGIDTDGRLVVRNSTFLNYNKDRGAAIKSSARLEVSNSVFAYNKSVTNHSETGYLGGAIYTSSIATLNKVSFIGNSAGKGGAIAVISSATIQNCTFYNNSADNGDALYYNTLAPYIIENNNFINNGYGLYNDKITDYLTASNNYWGHSSGPYNQNSNPNGLGDSTNYFVHVIPWLTEPDTAAPMIFPQNISIVSTTGNTASLNWSDFKVRDLAGYKVYYDTDSSIYSFKNVIDAGKDTAITITGLQQGKKYYISVTSYDNSGEESWFSRPLSAITTLVAVITTDNDNLNFDTLEVRNSKTLSLKITNTGTANLRIDSITTTSSKFRLTNIPASLQPGTSQTINVIFDSQLPGLHIADLKIFSNAVNNSGLVIPLTGVCVIGSAPFIISVQDVAGDQGGQVRVKFQRSRYDAVDATNKITTYSLWRFIPGGQWDAINLFNATQDSVYNAVAPTLGDSTIGGTVWTTFKVTAHTNDPAIFYTSAASTGYSIDNIAPAVPSGFKAYYADYKIKLNWNKNSEKDFQYYIIYRSTNPSFNPDSSAAYTLSTADTMMVDENTQPDKKYYYIIAAIDYAGNKSIYSSVVNAVDDVAPASPLELTAGVNNNKIVLTWKRNPEPDLERYYIYRSLIPDINPDTIANYTYATNDTFYVDEEIEFNKQYYYVIVSVDYSGNKSKAGNVASSVVTGVGILQGIPVEFSLLQNFPNPFNPVTTIRFDLPKSAYVKLSVYNILGEKISDIISEFRNAGYHSVDFDASSIPSGVYIYKIEADEYLASRKLVVAK